MCLAIPMKLIHVDGNEGIAESKGVRRRVRLDLLEKATLNDYVLIHAGYAIQVMDEKEAAETLSLLEAAFCAEEGDEG